ncbi:MAG: lysophospholipid acyltransferase family protein [Myxococcota bacterium]|nr:lysophospholipid acyltransferase family protein [Myxococcota bacterium]
MNGPRAADRVVSALARGGCAALGCLPVGAANALADAAAVGLQAWSAAHERRVGPRGRGLRRNQRIVFRDDLDPERARRLERDWSRHLARLAVDCARLSRLSPESLARVVDLRPLAAVEPLLAEGRGVLGVSGHIGVWELLAHLPRLCGIPLTVVARPRASPALEVFLSEVRRRGGARVIGQRGALWQLRTALARGEAAGLLVDENARRRPVFSPFLGTAAATSPVAAFLQRVTGAPIAVVTCPRTGPGRFEARLWDVIRPVPDEDADAQRHRVTRAVNDALSRAILAHPEQWLWSSRRFLTRPPGEEPGPDGLPPRWPAHAAAREIANPVA